MGWGAPGKACRSTGSHAFGPIFAVVPMMRRLFLSTVAFACAVAAFPQAESVSDAIIQAKALKSAVSEAGRDSISGLLKAALRKALDGQGGMAVNLDDLPLSRVEAPDGSFRLITWNVPRDDGGHAYEGFLLTRQGSVTTLFELRDMTSGIPHPESAELGADRWYGALYYQVIPVRRGGRTFYTLLGWKGYSRTETRKVVEVLSFRSGRPRFGAALFGGSGRSKELRKVYGFAFQSSMMLRYEEALRRIVMDHLSPLRPDLDRSNAFLGPDMSYDALVWEKGSWRLQRDIDARDPKRDGRPFNPPPRAPQP